MFYKKGRNSLESEQYYCGITLLPVNSKESTNQYFNIKVVPHYTTHGSLEQFYLIYTTLRRQRTIPLSPYLLYREQMMYNIVMRHTLAVQTPKYSSLRLVCFMMTCARYAQREDSLSFVFLIFTVSKFSDIKKKSKPEVFALENFSTHTAYLHRESKKILFEDRIDF